MIIGDAEFNLSKIRSRTLIMVSFISLFSVIILVFACLIYSQHRTEAHPVATILCIVFDSMNIIVSIFELNALFFFRQNFLKVLLYGTSISYLCVLITTIVEFSSSGGVTARIQEIMVIVSASFIVLLGAYKNYYAYEYFMKGRQALNQDIKDIRNSILSVESYEQGLKNSLG